MRDIDLIRIWGRTKANAEKLAETLREELKVDVNVTSEAQAAVADADIICTTTSATTPVLEGSWLPLGCHVNLVGAAILTAAEADVEVVTRSRFFVDSRASAMAQAGELNAAIEAGHVDESHILAEIGELLQTPEKGRSSDQDITVYKSLGVVAQDLASGLKAYQVAQEKNIGMELDW